MEKHRLHDPDPQNGEPPAKKAKVLHDSYQGSLDLARSFESDWFENDDVVTEHLYQKSMLEKLPAEVRQQVLQYVVPHGHRFDIWAFQQRIRKVALCYFPNTFVKGAWLPLKHVSGLFRVCKTLHEDVAYLFYGRNTFKFVLNREIPRPLLHAAGASFYSYGNLVRPLPIGSRFARYVKKCEVVYSGGEIADISDPKRAVQAWMSGFVEAFANGRSMRFTVLTKKTVGGPWSTQLWAGLVQEYATSANIRAEAQSDGCLQRFKVLISEDSASSMH